MKESSICRVHLHVEQGESGRPWQERHTGIEGRTEGQGWRAGEDEAQELSVGATGIQ